jgi:hypothetical protein
MKERMDKTYSVVGFVSSKFGHHVDPVDAAAVEHVCAIVRAAKRCGGYWVPKALDIQGKNGVLLRVRYHCSTSGNRAYICAINAPKDNVIRLAFNTVIFCGGPTINSPPPRSIDSSAYECIQY